MGPQLLPNIRVKMKDQNAPFESLRFTQHYGGAPRIHETPSLSPKPQDPRSFITLSNACKPLRKANSLPGHINQGPAWSNLIGLDSEGLLAYILGFRVYCRMLGAFHVGFPSLGLSSFRVVVGHQRLWVLGSRRSANSCATRRHSRI